MKRVPELLLVLFAYLLSWTASFVTVQLARTGGDSVNFDWYFECLFQAWAFRGLEQPFQMWLLSVIIFVPLAIWAIRRNHERL